MGQGTDFHLSQETPADWWEVEALYDLVFGPARTGLSSYRLRDASDPVANLCLVARDAEDVLAGAIRMWPVSVGQDAALLLGPIAVHPTRQGEGLGALLIFRVIELARASHAPRMLLVGDAPYYARFGFERLSGVTMPPPTNPDRVLGLSLAPGGWENVQGMVTRRPARIENS